MPMSAGNVFRESLGDPSVGLGVVALDGLLDDLEGRVVHEGEVDEAIEEDLLRRDGETGNKKMGADWSVLRIFRERSEKLTG